MAGQSLVPGCPEDVEMVLAQHLIRLFKNHHLTPEETKHLLEKVLLLVDAGKIE